MAGMLLPIVDKISERQKQTARLESDKSVPAFDTINGLYFKANRET